MIWTIGRDGSVVRCSYKCTRNHQHFIGSYEKAQQFLLGKVESNYGKKKLMDIIIYHQLNDRVMTKTSAELYDILMSASSTKDYWIPENERHDVIIENLDKAREDYLILDDEIFKNLNEDSPTRMHSRYYRLQKWIKNIGYN